MSTSDVDTPEDSNELWVLKETVHVDFGDLLGDGTFSKVYGGTIGEKSVAVKIFRDDSTSEQVFREAAFLAKLEGTPNVVPLLGIDQSPPLPRLVFPRISHTKPILDALPDMDLNTRCVYLCHVLCALETLHEKGIVHRDVKPQNVLFDLEARHGVLLDFGSAAMYHEGEPFEDFPGTMRYKAPECLLQFPMYTTAVDMWSFAAVMFIVMFGFPPWDKAPGAASQLLNITAICGTRGLQSFMELHADDIDTSPSNDLHRVLSSRRKRFDMHRLLDDEHAVATEEAVQILDTLFNYDFTQRPSAPELLRCPLFARVLARHEAPVLDRAQPEGSAQWGPTAHHRWSTEQLLLGSGICVAAALIVAGCIVLGVARGGVAAGLGSALLVLAVLVTVSLGALWLHSFHGYGLEGKAQQLHRQEAEVHRLRRDVDRLDKNSAVRFAAVFNDVDVEAGDMNANAAILLSEEDVDLATEFATEFQTLVDTNSSSDNVT